MTGSAIGGLFRYVGDAHRWAKGLTVKVVAVHRGDRVLGADDEVGQIQADDMLEFAPFVPEVGRFSFATGDASPWELVAVPE